MRSFVVIAMFATTLSHAAWNGYTEDRVLELDTDGISRLDIDAGAGKRLGADVMNMSVKGSSVAKGETLVDTAMTRGKDGLFWLISPDRPRLARRAPADRG